MPSGQQRRHAWLERKRLPQADKLLGSGMMAKCLQAYSSPRFRHKRGTARYNQTANQFSCRDLSVKPTYVVLDLNPTCRKSCQSSALSQSLFLPPILGTVTSADLHSKPLSPHPPPMRTRQVRSEENALPSALRKLQAKATKGLEIDRLNRLEPSEKKFCIPRQVKERDLAKNPAPLSLEINRQCLETTFTNREDRIAEGVLLPMVLRTEPSSGRTLRCMATKKSLGNQSKNVPTATQELGEKYSWFDSAIESYSSCSAQQAELETDHRVMGTDQKNTGFIERDLATNPEGLCSLELEYYTTQKIIEWIQQVNRILFSPSCTEAEEHPLTEQDTAIKIVYDGD